MTAFVLMNRKTGDLYEGYRVSLFDKILRQSLSNGQCINMGSTYSISLMSNLDYDGWIIYNPNGSPLGFFMNRKSETLFKVLGEL